MIYLNKRFNICLYGLVALIYIVNICSLFYFTTLPRCLTSDFESQIRYLLKKHMMTETDIANISTVFKQLQDTLQDQWPGSEVVPLGSLVTGIAMKNSDADCMVRVPNYKFNNETENRYLILQAIRLLEQHPSLYYNARPEFRSENSVSILKFDFMPTKKNCDVNFIGTHGLEISRMIAYYYSLDQRAFNIAAIIKIWFINDSRNKTIMITSYTLNLLIIFYLQQENILPPYYLIHNESNREFLKNIWSSNNTMNLYQLLGGFFKYYSDFDFKGYVVSVLLGIPIRREDFEKIYDVPEELTSFKTQNHIYNDTYISQNTFLVQDVISPRSYVLEPSTSSVDTFLSRIKVAAQAFESNPRDRFLNVLFVRDKYHDMFNEQCNL